MQRWIGLRCGASAAQVTPAWPLGQRDITASQKPLGGSRLANLEAMWLRLDAADRAAMAACGLK